MKQDDLGAQQGLSTSEGSNLYPADYDLALMQSYGFIALKRTSLIDIMKCL